MRADIVDCLSGSELRMVPEYVSQSSHDIPELFDEFSFHYISGPHQCQYHQEVFVFSIKAKCPKVLDFV